MASRASPQNLKVAAGRAVRVSYRLELESGLALEASKAPLWYVQGDATFPAVLQALLVGRRAGDSVVKSMSADHAFGPRREDLLIQVPRSVMPDAEAGDHVELERGGKRARAVVTHVAEDSVTVDFNHEFAGARVIARLHIEQVELKRPA